MLDPNLAQVLLGVVSNGLYDIVRRAGRPSRANASAAVESILSDTVRAHEDDPALLGLDVDDVTTFLESPEVSYVVRQLFAYDHEDSARENIRLEIRRLWQIREYGGKPAAKDAAIDRLYELLAQLCERGVDAALERGDLSVLELRNARRQRVLQDSLDGIARTLDVLTSRSDFDLPAIEQFIPRYLRQVEKREGTIIPPSLDSSRSFPIDELYVPARLRRLGGSESSGLSYEEFTQTLYRSVVLGNPGSGKSTLAKKLTSDIARSAVVPTASATSTIPILVVLREFGARKKDEPCSIVEFITQTCKSRYQLQAPSGAFEYLLSTGRCLVVFDGLDELLDTGYRTEISQDVQSFANLYPSTPILVTSREVGYDQAPLPDEVFPAFRLAEFGLSDVRRYAQRWFAAGSNLSSQEAKEQAERFIVDSAAVSDLRANALMLGLMCNLYKGSGYIPRNRPDVYEACSDLLFDRWDRLRQISVPLKFESLIRPTMQHLAYWIFRDQDLQSGVAERDLIEEAATFLLKRRFEEQAEAEFEAKRFIEFCRDRAWVFTDTGTTRHGQRLYQFTHRTFLEFFAARHLVRTYPSSPLLLEVLLPRIDAKEWDVVAELSFQLLERNVDGAADELLGHITPPPSTEPSTALINRLDFATRCLGFLVPSPSVTRGLTAAAVDLTMCWADSPSTWSEEFSPDEAANPAQSVEALMTANPENLPVIQLELAERLEVALSSDQTGSAAAELAFHLRPGRSQEPTDPERIADRILERQKPRLVELARKSPTVACDLAIEGILSADELTTAHGWGPVFTHRLYWMFPRSGRVPLSEIAVATVLWGPNAGMTKDVALALLGEIGTLVLTADRPWYAVGSYFPGGTWALNRREAGPSDWQPCDPQALSANQKFGLLSSVAAGAEEAALDDRQGEIGSVFEEFPGGDDFEWWPVWLLLRARFDEDLESGRSALRWFRLSEEQEAFLNCWLEGSLRLVEPD